MKLYNNQQYLRVRIDKNGDTYNYFNIHGMSFIEDRPQIIADVIVVKDSIPTKIIKDLWQNYVPETLESLEKIEEKEWNKIYEAFYDNVEDFIKNLGDYCYCENRYIKIKELTKEKICVDIIESHGMTKRLIKHISGKITEFYNPNYKKMTKMEWIKIYEKVSQIF